MLFQLFLFILENIVRVCYNIVVLFFTELHRELEKC